MIKINQLNKEFESRVRLGIMSILMVNDWVDFTEIKNLPEITDRNLAYCFWNCNGENVNNYV